MDDITRVRAHRAWIAATAGWSAFFGVDPNVPIGVDEARRLEERGPAFAEHVVRVFAERGLRITARWDRGTVRITLLLAPREITLTAELG